MKDRRLITWRVLGLISLVVLFGPSLWEHIVLARDPHIFNDDVRHWLCPYFRCADPSLFPNDVLVNYRQAMTPVGHRLLFGALARVADPHTISAWLPVAQYAALLVALGYSAWRMGGWRGAWATLALTLSSYVFLHHTAGGTSRSWGFLLVAMAAAFLLSGRAGWLAPLTIVATALYPPVAFVLGLTLAIRLLVQRARPARRITLLAVTAAASAVILMAETPRGYGRRLGAADIAAYPELGPGGRYGPDDRAPFLGVPSALADAFGRTLQGGEPAWIPALRTRIMAGSTYGKPSLWLLLVSGLAGWITLWGGAHLWRRRTPSRGLFALMAASAVAYAAAAWFAPALYLPQRYMIYTLPVLTVLLFPAALHELARHYQLKWPGMLVVGGTTACLLLLGGHGGGRTGLSIDAGYHPRLYAEIAALPADAFIAGWPEGIMDNIPWLCRRSVFINRESHEALHKDVADLMRARMSDLVSAYFATSSDSLERLRSTWGVSHLLIDLNHFEAAAPVYFEPYNEQVRQAHAGMRQQGSEILRRLHQLAVYQDGPLVLLALDRVSYAKEPLAGE